MVDVIPVHTSAGQDYYFLFLDSCFNLVILFIQNEQAPDVASVQDATV